MTLSPDGLLFDPIKVSVEFALVPPMSFGPVAEVTKVGVVIDGEVEKTRFVVVVPVVPAALSPVILLKHVIEADVQFVPP